MSWFEDLNNWGQGAAGAVAGAAAEVLGTVTDTAGGAAGAIGDVGASLQQAAEPLVQTLAEAPASIVAAAFEAPVAAVEAVQSLDTYLAQPFTTSAAEPISTEAPAAVFNMTTSAPGVAAIAPAATKETTSAPGTLETLSGAAVLLGAGVVSQIPSWYDIGTNIGTKLSDLTYENGVYAKNFIEGKEWGNKTGLVTSGTTKESKLGDTTRETIIGEVEKITGQKLSTSPLTSFALPEVKKEIASENIVVRAGGVTGLVVAGLGDWVLAEPGTAYLGEVQLLDVGADLLQSGGTGEMAAGLGNMFNLVVKSPSEREEAAKQTVTKYRVTMASSKSQCWGKPIGTSGCP